MRMTETQMKKTVRKALKDLEFVKELRRNKMARIDEYRSTREQQLSFANMYVGWLMAKGKYDSKDFVPRIYNI